MASLCTPNTNCRVEASGDNADAIIGYAVDLVGMTCEDMDCLSGARIPELLVKSTVVSDVIGQKRVKELTRNV